MHLPRIVWTLAQRQNSDDALAIIHEVRWWRSGAAYACCCCGEKERAASCFCRDQTSASQSNVAPTSTSCVARAVASAGVMLPACSRPLFQEVSTKPACVAHQRSAAAHAKTRTYTRERHKRLLVQRVERVLSPLPLCVVFYALSSALSLKRQCARTLSRATHRDASTLYTPSAPWTVKQSGALHVRQSCCYSGC